MSAIRITPDELRRRMLRELYSPMPLETRADAVVNIVAIYVMAECEALSHRAEALEQHLRELKQRLATLIADP